MGADAIAALRVLGALAVLGSVAAGTVAGASTLPPRNPFLVDGISSMPHFGPDAQDSTPIAGPTGHVDLGPDQLRRLPGGIGNGVYVSAPAYAGGVEVIWTVNSSRVAKIRIDGGRFIELAAHSLPGQPQIGAREAEDLTRALDAARDEAELVGVVRARFPFWLERVGVRAGIYPMMDRDGSFYVVAGNEILVFGDARPNDPGSPIAIRRRMPVPPEILSDWAVRRYALGRWWRGELPERKGDGPSLGQILEILRDTALGLSMTWDGKVVIGTVSGGVAVVDRELRGPPVWTRLDGEIVTNSFAVDDRGGIYVVTDRAMHRLVWTGSRLSRDAADGAWSAPYGGASGALTGIRAGSQGSGSTPTLMGFGPDEDRLVVITDGAERMRLVAFWRDAIPSGGSRIAGEIDVTFGDPARAVAQSEQSVAVWGDGAFVVNNAGPDSLPSAFENVVAVGVTRPGPRGVERFAWDGARDRWRSVWARADVGSPSTVPLVSGGSRQAYVQDVRDGRFEVVGLDWETGETRTRLVFPRGQAWNGAYTQIQLLPSGDLYMGMLTGPVRTVLAPPPQAGAGASQSARVAP